MFKRPRLSSVLIPAGALALFLGLGPRLADAAYPERYITIICASGAGGIVDVTTRILAEHMSRTLGRTVVVQNEPGAGSTLATGVRTHEEVVLSTQHRCSKASLQALECLVAGEGFVVGYAPESNSSQ